MKDDLPNTLRDCPVGVTPDFDDDRRITIVPKTTASRLTEKEYVDYWNFRKDVLSYLLQIGKDEEKALGYSPYTVYADSYRLSSFDQWVWDYHDGYRTPPTHADATTYLEEVAFSDRTQTAKGKIQEMLTRYSKFLQHQYGQDKWEFDYSFDGSGGNHQPRDWLTVEERQKIRQAALQKGSIPAYNTLTVAERKQWSGYIAQELNKPYETITEDEWNQVTGWKLTSLVWTSLDAGLRPVEVGRAKTSWVDIENQVLRIPKAESSKNEGNWHVSLTQRTTSALDHWLQERALRDRYEGTDALWLTMRGNRYGSRALSRLIKNLCADAGIDIEDRSMTWYSIRHSVGTLMTKERDLAATKAQLRHKSPLTTMKYDQVPVEDRRDALDRMG